MIPHIPRVPPRMRPLTRGLLLAMLALPLSAVAGNLDNESAEVLQDDPAEFWNLRSGSRLLVTGGSTFRITARDTSVVRLDGATVDKGEDGGTYPYALVLRDSATLTALNSTVRGGGIIMEEAASLHLQGSRVLVSPEHGVPPNPVRTIGIDMLDGHGRAVIDSTEVRASEVAADADAFNRGLGIRMGNGGRADVINGSHVQGDNHAAYLLGRTDLRGTTILNVDASTLQSTRGAAVRVTALGSSTVDINVVNGAQLIGGDGHLLRVGSLTSSPSNGRTGVNFSVDNARLIGDVTRDVAAAPNSLLAVSLRNHAQIDGRFSNVTTASIDQNSTWLMTGDSSVGHLALGATGTVGLGSGAQFNTLALDSFSGQGGTLVFNTALGDDTSATDRLVIAGDADGQAHVRVLNAGGAGAKTDRGIELIDIGGASNAQFDLMGRAVGGQYEYFLVKDANGNWYLRSDLATTPDPCVGDPTLPACKQIDPVDPVDPPTPVLRPETGAYLANQFTLREVLRHSAAERQHTDAAAEGVSGWASIGSTQSRWSAAEDQLDLRVQRARLQLGADLGVFDDGRGRVGVMGTAARSRTTSQSKVTGYRARGELEGGALGVYGNWRTDALYVDANVQRGQFRNRVQGDGLTEERYDSDLWQSSLEAGYRFDIGRMGGTVLSLQPELQLVYTDASTDVHVEANGTRVRAQGDSGLSGRMGLRLQGESSSAVGASVSPYLAANWYREGAGNGIAFDDDVLKAGIPRNRYELSAGARLQYRSGFSARGGIGVMRGDHGYREATGTLSVAYSW